MQQPNDSSRDPMQDAIMTLKDIQIRLKNLEGKDKEIEKQSNFNDFILKDSKRSLELELNMIKEDIKEMKTKLMTISKNIKLVGKEFRMVAKSDEVRRVERAIEVVMAARLVGRDEAKNIIEGILSEDL